jgi:predicted DNA binding CopG/RHH family protein
MMAIGAKRPTRQQIPKFRSREEEANFWDTHDLADYWDEFQPVRVRFAKKLSLSQGITIRLDPKTLSALRSRAEKDGIGPTTLARMWIMERLREVEVAAPKRSRRRSA